MQKDVSVNLTRKEELIMAKQIRQNTTKMLQRPSYFHSPESKKAHDNSWIRDMKQEEQRISTPMLEALLVQKKEGKLVSSALDDWLQNLEAQFDDHYEKCDKIDKTLYEQKEMDIVYNTNKEKNEVRAKQNEENKEIKTKTKINKLQEQFNEKRRKLDGANSEQIKQSKALGFHQSEKNKDGKRKAWVSKFEAQLNQCYTKREEGKRQDWLDNVETEFDRCLSECHAMDEFKPSDYKIDDLDIVVPKNELLDTSFAKHKADLNRRKSLTSGKKNRANNEKYIGDQMASPRLSNREQRSNAARKQHHENVKDSLSLGREPDVVQISHTNKSLFGTIYSSIEKKKTSNPFYESFEQNKGIKNELINMSNIIEPVVDQVCDDNKVLPEAPKRKKCNITAKVKPYNPFIDEDNAYEEVIYPEVKLKKDLENNENYNVNDEIKTNSFKPEDTISFENINNSSSKDNNTKIIKYQESKEAKKPFKALNDCLFGCYTSCIPWCIAKRFYWKTHS